MPSPCIDQQTSEPNFAKVVFRKHLPGSICFGRRRKRRYLESRRRGEAEYQAGTVDAAQLQRAHDAALSITAHAKTRAWFRARATDRAGVDWRDQV